MWLLLLLIVIAVVVGDLWLLLHYTVLDSGGIVAVVVVVAFVDGVLWCCCLELFHLVKFILQSLAIFHIVTFEHVIGRGGLVGVLCTHNSCKG